LIVFYIYICYFFFFFFSSRRRHTRSDRDWSSDVCSSDLRGVGDRSALWGMCSKSATSNGGRPLCDIASVQRTRDLDAPPHRDPQGEGAPPSYFPENGSPRGAAARFAASDFSGVFLRPTP